MSAGSLRMKRDDLPAEGSPPPGAALAAREPGIGTELLGEARRRAAEGRVRVVEALEALLGLDPEAFVARLGQLLRYPTLTMQEMQSCSAAFDVVPYAECVERGCVALRAPAGDLLLAIADPFADELLAWGDARVPGRFSFALVYREDLAAYLAGTESSVLALDHVSTAESRADGAGTSIEDLSLKAINEATSETVRLIRSTLRDALRAGASDVHIECSATGMAIKFRIDGMLTSVKMVPDRDLADQAIARVKVLAELDITERRVPQDGRFKVLDRGREIDFRVSIMPSIHGEDAVLRALDKSRLEQELAALSLAGLGFNAEDVATIRKLSRQPYGMFLVTGPTGSGKTTTLYAAISEINRGEDKIVTIEDPVEYQLPGVLQIPVNEKKGLSFARGLRSILRHDPDKIMVGEIRDAETANIAVQSALTGHLVFTTVHANNVTDVVGRFTHMNVDLHSFVAALNGILAQRLMRVLCPACAEPDAPDDQLLHDSGLTREQTGGWRFRRPRGCRECRGAGYKGRRAIAELMVLNDELRELIVARAPIRSLKRAAHANGARFLREAALDVVRRGETTLQEANRVTFVE
jgi:general secretion pathway protein E